MVELQSCATLVNASALCVIEQEVKGDNANVVAEISAELERERQRNKDLMERISMLEAQIRERNMETQANHQHAVARTLKKFKRQKIEQVADEEEKKNTVKGQMVSQNKPDTEGIVPKEISLANRLINWMSMDDGQTLYQERFKDSESVADFKETDSDDEIDGITETFNAHKGYPAEHIDHERSNVACMERFSDHGDDRAAIVKQEDQKTSYILDPLSETAPFEVPSSGSIHKTQNRKPLKVAFCPKEVKRIIESEALLQNNAQSHTMRKIIVFASLGIRHGCEDMHELSFNHFSILKKGEPYVSPTSPGEHVLYENPGVRRKVFYPNRQNPVLCPVQILEEEKAMRPSDSSCPSCLFLCIKYGGRTRNLPQNEYVRQRMGRNKLKSFGPLMCRMAMLFHIRSGSFFFKALGITLLFMAGFPDDLVQRETKYRSLDLLQKYYRTDEDAEGEELFLPHPISSDNGTQNPQSLTKKTHPAKSRGRKQSNAITKSQKTPCQQSTPINSAPATQFGLTGYSTPPHTYAMAAFHSMPSQISKDTSHMPNEALAPPCSNVHHGSYGMVPPPQAASTFVPVMYWPPPNAFLHGPYHPSTYGYHSFPSAASYMSFHTQPYHTNHPTCSSSLPKLLEGSGKNDIAAPQDSDSHSDSSSSGGTEKKQ